MAEPGVGCSKVSGVFLFLRLESSLCFDKGKPSLFAVSRVRLGHAASIVRRANRLRQIPPAARRALEPRPTKTSRTRTTTICARS